MARLSLENRIKLAKDSLSKAFGDSRDQEGEGADRFLDEASLIEAYKLDASKNSAIEQFLSITKTIRKMRSSFLPIDYFVDQDNTERFSEEISDNIAKMESYENTFMRMIGMPSVASSLFKLTEQDSEIRSSENLIIVNPLTGKQSYASYEEVRAKIIDVRQLSKDSRRISIDNSIYNISESSDIGDSVDITNLSSIEKANLFGLESEINSETGQEYDFPDSITLNEDGTGYENPITGETIQVSTVEAIVSDIEAQERSASILAIEDDLWKFCYLLIPPIQDIEISRAINEADKIVAPPFSGFNSRTVNNNKIRPTLLESIIRIRLDRVSGTSAVFGAPSEGYEDFEPESDTYGILESLFVLRLRSAIAGMADKLYEDIDEIVDAIQKHKRSLATSDPNTGGNLQQESVAASNQLESTEDDAKEGDLSVEAKSVLEQQKLIEDSIMLLLGDNSEVLDLQLQTQRSSSIHNSHMMSGLIDIVDIPRRRIIEDIEKINKSKNDSGSAEVDQLAKKIGVSLGTDIGIGTIDVAVFALALFTIPEKNLLGLLSKAQFNNLKNGEFKHLLVDAEKEDTVESINTLTQLIIDGYKLFISDLKGGASPSNT